MTKISGFTAKTKHLIVYPEVSSALKPIPHSDDLPVLIPYKTDDFQSENESESPETSSPSGDHSSEDISSERSPYLIQQYELNDLVRNLYLPKQDAELLASRF